MNDIVDKALFSIVIPAYNCEDWVGASIESLIAQTETRWEALCVDDGSSDDTLVRLREWEKKDNRVRVFTQENAGVSVARNVALSHACGIYALLLDADDRLEPNALTTLKKAQEQHPEAMIVFGIKRVFADKAKEDKNLGPYAASHLTKPELLTQSADCIFRMHAFGVNKLYSLETIRKYQIEFPAGVPMNEDLIFFLSNAYHVAEFYCLPEPLYSYYEREDSVCVQLKHFNRPIKDYTNLVTLFIPFMKKLNALPLRRRVSWQMGLYMRIIHEKRAQMSWMHELGIERPELEKAMDKAAADFRKATPLHVKGALLLKTRIPILYKALSFLLKN